jgi:thioredoxin reductase
MRLRQGRVAVIGAGPIGLSAAANLVDRGMEPLIFEAGERVAASIWDWGHVRLFTPWSYLIDPASRRLLESAGGWTPPDEDVVPLGRELVERYLDPLAALDVLRERIHLCHRVVHVSRVGHDRMRDGTRGERPFLIVADTPGGRRRYEVDAVIDASGTWTTPNPLGAGGVPADGEAEHTEAIRYGMPDVLGRERGRYAGKRVLVVGSGHSAIGTVLALHELARTDERTLVAWSVRRDDPSRLWGGGAADQIAARGELGDRVHEAVHSGRVALFTGMSISSVEEHPEGLKVVDVDGRARIVVDEIVVATGCRPDLEMHRELRLELDVPTESTHALGPLIDPNHHSCGSAKPHGATELAHPEEDFFIVGMKSYGRAPTFLLRTGYEQARSVVASLAGDEEAAGRVELVLPQTGVCSTDLAYTDGRASGTGCC